MTLAILMRHATASLRQRLMVIRLPQYGRSLSWTSSVLARPRALHPKTPGPDEGLLGTDSDKLAESVRASLDDTIRAMQNNPLGLGEGSVAQPSIALNIISEEDRRMRAKVKESVNRAPMKKYKPSNPGRRWYRHAVHSHLWKGKPYRPLTLAKRKTGGRNNTGRITCRHRGGGHKRRIRLIDYDRKESGPHNVLRIERDPNRTAHIALLEHQQSKEKSYIIAPQGLRAGDVVESYRGGLPNEFIQEMGGKIDPAVVAARTSSPGNCLPLSMIAVGTVVHNIGLHFGGPGQICRAAGTFGRVVYKDLTKRKAIVSLQSGEQRYVHINACATLGVVSNAEHQHESLGKAGRRRWLGWRPSVRGMAMNACDHPHGGGRGKSKGNVLSQSPWGVLAKGGYKTRKGKHINKQKVKDRPRGKENRLR